jgi:hypothetical protein
LRLSLGAVRHALPRPKVDTNCTAPSLIPTVNVNTVRSFSTHGQRSAAKGSSTTVSRSDIRLIQHLDSSARGLVRRWLLIGYFPILYNPHPHPHPSPPHGNMFAASLRIDICPQRKESSSTSHARNPFNLNFFDSAQCLMLRRWRLIGYFPILYNPHPHGRWWRSSPRRPAATRRTSSTR